MIQRSFFGILTAYSKSVSEGAEKIDRATAEDSDPDLPGCAGLVQPVEVYRSDQAGLAPERSDLDDLVLCGWSDVLLSAQGERLRKRLDVSGLLIWRSRCSHHDYQSQ